MKFNVDEIAKQVKDGKYYIVNGRGNGKCLLQAQILKRVEELEAEERHQQELLENECTNPNG